MTIKTRFAPSPTGFLHLGGARTALFNYLLAKRSGGTFVLRIEDTDEARSTGASTDEILRSLEWLGLLADEGPYFQSKRLPIYHDHLRQLIERDLAYPAFDTKDELYEARIAANTACRPNIYDGPSRHMSKAEGQRRIRAGEPHVWRLRTPESGTILISESLQGRNGRIPFDASVIGDFVIIRETVGEAFGMPLYNFACAIDDALMGITDVLRGVEHLGNSPLQALIYDAFGYTVPRFTHLPLIFKKGKKMSKRDTDTDPRFPVSVGARRDLGYLPEATINHLALLGWSHPKGKEVFDREELLATWSVDRLGKANANFDEDKYAHVNKAHMRMLSPERLAAAIWPFFKQAGIGVPRDDVLAERAVLEQKRCSSLSEFPEALNYFFREPTPDAAASALIASVDGQRVIAVMTHGIEAISGLPKTADDFQHIVANDVMRMTQLPLKDVSQPIRAVLTGRLASPGLFEVMALLGRDTVLRRLKAALKG